MRFLNSLSEDRGSNSRIDLLLFPWGAFCDMSQNGESAHKNVALLLDFGGKIVYSLSALGRSSTWAVKSR